MMIVPGCPNALMMAGGGDPLDEHMRIERAVRFNSAESPSLSRTTAAAGGDRDKWWVFLWFKRSALGTVQYLHGADSASADAIYINASNKLCIDIAGTTRLVSAHVFRDLAAHGGLLVCFDASNGTAAQRLRAFYTHNAFGATGEIVTWDTDTRGSIAAGTAKTMHNSIAHVIGKSPTAASGYWDGYISEHRIGTWSGSPPALSDHCIRHPKTDQWRPKPYGGAYGTHGSRLDFADGSAATSTALGKDRSGNNNDWTPVNISVAAGPGQDWLEDTPTKNACTWNPLISGDSTKSNGALDAAGTARGTMNASAIACQWEITANAASVVGGVVSDSGTASTVSVPNGSTYGFRLASGTLDYTTNGSSWTNIASGLTGARYPYASGGANTLNCGQRALAYSLSDGFKPLTTKNLPIQPPVMKSTTAFVAAIDSGANIQATLAAARAGWTDYIEIFKRRDSAEGWRWRFSDDSANYLDSSSTAAKAAFPSLAGTSYAGYAIKTAAANGVATGTFVHANGVASVITDGLSNARKMVILHRESTGGGSWPTYHPDLTAGKLAYLNTTGFETTDASINTVTASGFTADASLPSGTYRWIAIAGIDGFSKLWTYTGNASADGPFVNCEHQPSLLCAKGIDSGASLGNWIMHDAVRDTKNVMTVDLYFNSSGAEITSPNFDSVSAGVKGRWNTSADPNVSATRYIGFSFAAFPFRYANAR